MTSPPPDIAVIARVSDDERDEVLALADAAAEADGVSPIDDQVRLDLKYSDSADVRHLLATSPEGTILGYAHVDLGSAEATNAHLVVHPRYRHHGVGTALVQALIAESEPRSLRVWAHGDEAAAKFLSGRLGFRRVRDLWQMRRALDVALTPPAYPPEVTVRTFEPGRDDEAWVAVNAAAFASHPEQGALTVDDLHQRMEQPWFDAAGFFLAERDGALVGFHWTKVHPAGEKSPKPIGEVYAVGVSPDAQGLGLGKALTSTGLLHLQQLGLTEVILYVEGDNTPAIAVYTKLGFERSALDVMYEHP